MARPLRIQLAGGLYHVIPRGDRREAMALAYRAGGDTMPQIADAFGVHYATVSRAVRTAGRARQADVPMLDCKT